MSNVNYSFLVGSFFFILFGVFILFQDQLTPTGFASIEIEKQTFTAGEFLDGKLTLSLNTNDFINENSEILMEIKHNNELKNSRSMSITEFFQRTGAEINKTIRNNENGYSINADFILDIGWFALNIDSPGNYDLTASLKHGETIYAQNSKQVTITPKPEGLPEISEVVFGVLDDNDRLNPDKTKFHKDEKLGCGVIYLSEVTNTKAYFYAPGDQLNSPTYTVVKSDSNSILLGEQDGQTAVLLIQEIEVKKQGQWSCTVELYNNVGSVKRSSSNSLFQIKSIGTLEDDPQNTECSEDWTCTVWSDCVNGRRSRSCFDKNECNTLLNKPGTTETCTSGQTITRGSASQSGRSESVQGTPKPSGEKIESSIWKILMPVIILVVLAGIIITALVLIKKKKSKAAVEEAEKQEKKEKVQTVQQSKPLTEVENYVLNSLNQNISKEEITKKLVSKGWKHEKISRTLNKMIVYKFVEESIGKGNNKELLKRSLLQKGWPEDLVEETFQNV